MSEYKDIQFTIKENFTFIEPETADIWHCCLEITDNMYKMKKKQLK